MSTPKDIKTEKPDMQEVTDIKPESLELARKIEGLGITEYKKSITDKAQQVPRTPGQSGITKIREEFKLPLIMPLGLPEELKRLGTPESPHTPNRRTGKNKDSDRTDI